MKAAVLFTLALLGASATAQVVAPDLCNMSYEGGFDRGGGPLTITLQRVANTEQIDVVVLYRGAQYFGHGVCDVRGIDFDLQNGYHHSGQFEPWGNGGTLIDGALFFNGRQTDHFMVYAH